MDVQSHPADLAQSTPCSRSSSGFTIRSVVETAFFFLSAILLLRAVVIEPFGVPTGSMAPTLAGNHKTCICPRCGQLVMVGCGNPSDRAQSRSQATAWCPNCEQTNLGLDRIAETAGDRLLVDKNVFEMRSPRRLEVAVFRCPSDLSKPYVKRVVGLPGERIQIVDGDIHINGRLFRKTLAESMITRIPIFNSMLSPGKHGWSTRWQTGDPAVSQSGSLLADATGYLDGSGLRWKPINSHDNRAVIYRNWLLDERREEPIRDAYSYNGGQHRHELQHVRDFIVEFQVDEVEGDGSLEIGLRDGADDVVARIALGTAAVETQLVGGRGQLLAEGLPASVLSGRQVRVIFAFVDRRVTMSIDGREVFSKVDLPEARSRNPVSRPLWFNVVGAGARISQVVLSRDIHYAPAGRNAIHEPWPLGDDEYFMLGDNSANSEDSRFWSIPGIARANFLGKPLLLHQPSRWARIRKGWETQTIDWDRVRWIR